MFPYLACTKSGSIVFSTHDFTQNRVRKEPLFVRLISDTLIDSRKSRKIMRQIRHRKTGRRERTAIIRLYENGKGEWTMADLGQLFGITRGRVSQIITNYYEEREIVNDIS